MSQKAKMKMLLENDYVTTDQARRQGIKNPRQQVHFLRLEGYIIDNYKPKHYRLICN